MFRKLQGNKRGFTLIELIVVIAIIGILVTLAMPKFKGITADANVAAMRADSKVLSNASLMYSSENSDALPVGEAVTVTLPEATVGENKTLKNVIGTETVNAIDKDKLKEYVKSTKNDISEYVIVTSGADEGEVLYLGKGATIEKGIKNKAGVAQFGINEETVVE